jgi:two-component system nitrogen regulation response regulator NtrX
MSKSKLQKILLVDDDPRVLEALTALFEGQYYILDASSGRQSVALAEEHSDIAVVVMDIKMEGMDGITAARNVRELRPHASIIFHTGYPGDYEEQQIDVQEKPFDYVQKGHSALQLIRSVRNGAEAYCFKTEGRSVSEHKGLDVGLVGQSPHMQRVIREICKVAQSDNKVMILGETGTGKEIVARAIHDLSARQSRPLAILHCNHKSPDLVETELFGHKKGAFTTAVADRVGLFEYGNGGTVFLDEIGDLDITTQAKLLRVLESGEYTRIGDPTVQTTDIRLLCATHKNLEEMVSQGMFRQDLYYRLKGVQLRIPTLRERREDIPDLVEHFASRFTLKRGLPPKVFDQSAIEALIRFDWPGNVRQLLDTVESVIVLADSDLIMATDVESYLELQNQSNGADLILDGLAAKVEAYRRALVVEALRKTDGNIAAAATLLKSDKSNLRKYVIENYLSAE